MKVEIDFKNGRTIELAKVIFIMRKLEGVKKIMIDYYNEEIDEDMELVTTMKINANEIEHIEIVEFNH